jgi:hypothetical protein
MVRLDGQNNKALFLFSLETSASNRVPRLSTHPFSKTSLKGGVSSVAESAQLEKSSPLSSPAFPSYFSPALPSSSPVPSTACLRSPVPVVHPAALQGGWCDCFGRRVTPPSCQLGTLTLCLVSCTSPANSCLAGPVSQWSWTPPPHHPHQKGWGLKRQPQGS